MKVIKDLLGSKKFVTTMIGMVVSIVVTLGLDPEIAKVLVPVIMTMIVACVLGQGIADHGKERAKIEANGVALDAIAKVAASDPPT